MSEANPIAELLAGVRRMLPDLEASPTDTTTEAQWHELASAVDELVEVVLVQQDLIENLLLRTTRLEGREIPREVSRGA